jgi:hypothetical protein
VLLGPASYGTFAAAFAIAGNPGTLDTLRTFGIQPPDDIGPVLQSMTGVYQLLPWNSDVLPWLQEHDLADKKFWETGVDRLRLEKVYRWASDLDSTFFNDRTSIILGERDTPIAVEFQNGKLEPSEFGPGDGTFPMHAPSWMECRCSRAGRTHDAADDLVGHLGRDPLAARQAAGRSNGTGCGCCGRIPVLAEPPLRLDIPGARAAARAGCGGSC